VLKRDVKLQLTSTGFVAMTTYTYVPLTKGKSCATNLLTAFETWTKRMDKGMGIATIERWQHVQPPWAA